jgi:hypothetical protein
MVIDPEFLIKVFEETFQSDEQKERKVIPPMTSRKHGYIKPLEFMIIERWPKFAYSNGRSYFQNDTTYVIAEMESGDVLGFYVNCISTSWKYQTKLSWKLLSDEMGEDAVPESLIGIYYCDNEVLGLDDDESLTASKSENKYKAEWIINSDVNRRYLTTDEAEHFRLFGIIVNNDSINDKDQAFYVANF